VRLLLFIGASLGFLSVALGAFASHGLRSRLSEAQLSTFQTGVQYQMGHALAILLVGVLAVSYKDSGPDWTISAWFFVIGVVLFSGSLYAMALGQGLKRLGWVTPLGGLAFLAGWALLAAHLLGRAR